MRTPKQNYDIIKAVLDTDKNLLVTAVRDHQSVRGASGLLRTSTNSKFDAMLGFIDNMDSRSVPREKIADWLENDFSPGQWDILGTKQPEELAEAIKTFNEAATPSKHHF